MTNISSHSLTLARVDLNLMLALDALLRERSVTRAAESLGLSQPALSSSLAKLRRYFRDDLLARVGNNYELTPLAAELATLCADAIAATGRLFGTQEPFVPSSSNREFSLYLSDYSSAVLSAPLSMIIRRHAPHVGIRILHQDHLLVPEAADRLREHDGLVMPRGYIDGPLSSIELFTDRYVCLVATENHAVGDRLGVDQLAQTPLVAFFNSAGAASSAVIHLRLTGIEPWIETATESMLAIPFLVAGTDRIGFMPSLLAERHLAAGEVRIVDVPLSLPDIVEALWWSPIFDNDAGHQWLRTIMREAATQVRFLQRRGQPRI